MALLRAVGCWSLLACALVTHSASASETRGAATGARDTAAAKQTLVKKRSQLDAAGSSSAPARSWRSYKKLGWRRGYVTLTNPGNGRQWKGYVLGPGDKLLSQAEQRVRGVLASWRTGRSARIDPKLIRLIAQVSDVFGGRTIRVVSGYREQSHAKDSHHKHGEALDFSIEGVPNWAVRDYLRSLRHTGIGFYPNSSFVHMDVRGYPAYWVDLSGPGAPPRYVAELPSSRKDGSTSCRLKPAHTPSGPGRFCSGRDAPRSVGPGTL